MRYNIFFSIILISIILIFDSAYGATYNTAEVCKVSVQDYEALNNSYNALAQNYFNLNSTIDSLNSSLTQTSRERDYYKSIYENSSLSSLTVKDFLDMNQSINNIYIDLSRQTYNFNATLSDFKTEIVKINIYLLTIVIVIEFILLKWNLFKGTLIKIRAVNFVYKEVNTIFKSVKQSSLFLKVKNYVLVNDDTKKDDKKPA